MAVAAKIRVTSAHMAAPVVKPQGQSNPRWGLMAVGLAVSMIPIVGPGVMYFVERHRHSAQATDEKKSLTHWYRNQIAAQLGIDPREVKISDLELAARTNPTFKQMLDRVEKDQTRSNRASLVGAAVATPFSVMGAGGIAAKATEVGLSVAAGGAASLIGKDDLLVDDVANHINRKRLAGQPIGPEDVFFLRLAHDKPLQDVLKKQNGAAFHKMAEAQQVAVMRTMPNGYYAHAAELAQAVNSGGMTEQDLVIAASKQQAATSWATRVGGSRAQQGSFVNQVSAQRAAQTVSGPTV
jgi:hypothetical protein